MFVMDYFHLAIELLAIGVAVVWGAWIMRFQFMKIPRQMVIQIPKEMMPKDGQPLQIQFMGGLPPGASVSAS